MKKCKQSYCRKRTDLEYPPPKKHLAKSARTFFINLTLIGKEQFDPPETFPQYYKIRGAGDVLAAAHIAVFLWEP